MHWWFGVARRLLCGKPSVNFRFDPGYPMIADGYRLWELASLASTT